MWDLQFDPAWVAILWKNMVKKTAVNLIGWVWACTGKWKIWMVYRDIYVFTQEEIGEDIYSYG